MTLKGSYVQSIVEERLLETARLRSQLSRELFNPYDFRQLQANLLHYVSSLKSLLLTLPRDMVGDGYLQLYRRVGGLELLVLRATDVNQLLKYAESADDIFMELVNLLYRLGIISEAARPSG